MRCCGIVAMTATVILGGLGAGAAEAQFTTGTPEAQVRAREIAFAKTMADRDFDAFGRFISEEAVFFNGNTPLRGKEAVLQGWRRFFEGARAPFSWQPDVVVVLESGTLALSSGPVTGPTGEAAGRFNSIWRLDPDGVWRVVFDKGS